MSTDDDMSDDQHLVRPRWVWGGLLLALAGTAILGVGIAETSWWTAVGGAVVAALGVAGSVRGGVMYDVHATKPLRHEAHDVATGEEHHGVAPDDDLQTSATTADARATSLRTQTASRRSSPSRRPPLRPLGALLLLLVATLILALQGSLYPFTVTGQDNALRDLGLAVVVGLVGLRALFSPGRHVPSTVLGVVCGLGFAAQAAFAAHGAETVAVVEWICAAVVVLGALMSLDASRQAGRGRIL